ncbi:MAG: hypothetical protein Fur0046_08410 [Cyanobacteria bacterium J069]
MSGRAFVWRLLRSATQAWLGAAETAQCQRQTAGAIAAKTGPLAAAERMPRAGATRLADLPWERAIRVAIPAGVALLPDGATLARWHPDTATSGAASELLALLETDAIGLAVGPQRQLVYAPP